MRNRSDNIKSIEFTIRDEQQKLEQNVPLAQRNVPNVFSLKYIWKIRGAILFLLSVLSVAIGISLSSEIFSFFLLLFRYTCKYKNAIQVSVSQSLNSLLETTTTVSSNLAEKRTTYTATTTAVTTTRALRSHDQKVYSVAFDRNDLLASGSGDRTIKLWNSTTGELVRILTSHGVVYSVAFGEIWQASLTSTLASGSYMNISLWDTSTGELFRILTGHTHNVLTIAFDAYNVLASGSADKTIKIWTIKV